MSAQENNLYKFGEYVLDCSERTLWRGGEAVPLAPKAVETLCLLVQNHGRLMTKDELMSELWANTFVEEKNLAQNVFVLRKILGESGDGGRKYIETVPRRGYRFIAEVRPVEVRREEVVEVSLSKQTTIRAESEGDVSSAELTAAVKATAESLSLDKARARNETKEIAAHPKSRFSFTLPLTVGILSFLAISLGFWFWRSREANSRQSSSAQYYGFPNLAFQRLTDSGTVYQPVISPDKQQIAYIFYEGNKNGIKLQNLATASVTVTVEPIAAEIKAPIFSRDGNYIFYIARDGGKEGTIYQTPIYGGFSRKIVTDVRSDTGISPDGEWLAFFRYAPAIKGTHLIVCRTDGSEERIVTTRTGKNFYIVWDSAPAFSPDGKRIVAAALTESSESREGERKQYLVEIDLADGSERPLSTPDWSGFIKAEWTADGKHLLVLAQETPDAPYEIWRLDYPGGEAVRITNDLNNYLHFSQAPDSSLLLTSETRIFFNLWLINAEKPAEARQLTFSTAGKNGFYGLMWTPDAKRIIYSLTDGLKASNIWAIEVETQKTIQLTFDKDKMNWFPIVTPDGQSIIFSSNRTGSRHLWQMNMDGSDLRQITNGGGETHPQISPDGKWLIYVTPGDVPHTLYKKRLDADGETIKLLDYSSGPSHVAPDSKQIVVHYYDPAETQKMPWKFGLMSFEGDSRPVDMGFTSERSIMRWKQDGSGIYFLSPGRTLNNIWLYPLNTRSPVQLTHFDAQRIVNLSVSPDGKTLAVARGATNSDAIKITGFN